MKKSNLNATERHLVKSIDQFWWVAIIILALIMAAH